MCGGYDGIDYFHFSGQIEGKFRQPKGLVHVWGDDSTEVIVSENKVRYKFDFTRIMFAKGNTHERALLPKKIKEGEVIIDMFAGIGYFTLGIAKTKKPQKHSIYFVLRPFPQSHKAIHLYRHFLRPIITQNATKAM